MWNKIKTTSKMNYRIYILILLVVAMGCSKMEDNYKQYLVETIYPGKVSNVKAEIGIEKVYLKWNPPTDPKSSRILVKYTAVDSVITDSIVTNIVITGLTESRGYEFDVSSLDDYGNKSVSEFVTAKPFTQAYVDNNIVPSIPLYSFTTKTTAGVKTSTGLIKWEKLTTSIMKYIKGNYTLSIVGGKTYSGECLEKIVNKKKVVGTVEIELPEEDLHGKNLNFSYTMSFLPLQSNGKAIVDTVTVTINSDKIKIIN
jgi:hypothetical protein